MDLRDLDDTAFAEIEDAFETHSVLVFPGQPLDDDAQIAFSRRFGDLVMYDNRAALHRARPYAITTHPQVLHRTTMAKEGPTAE